MDHYNGSDFLDTSQWKFFSEGDPTHGRVDFQQKEDAERKGLAYVQDDGTTVLKVDNTTQLTGSENRASIRISTTKKFNQGLFIADFYGMPHGCSVWPAYWSVGPNWPSGGEIDILEGVNKQTFNQYTLHTSSGCSSTNSVADKIKGVIADDKQCASSGNDNTGCAFHSEDPRSYGQGFNLNGGGVFAHLWNSRGITIWLFPRGHIPQDILNGNPDPDSWEKPEAFWPSDHCNMDHFHDHSLVIDTTLCGDWAGDTFQQDGCPGTCDSFISDPDNFHTAHWKINYISVYQASS